MATPTRSPSKVAAMLNLWPAHRLVMAMMLGDEIIGGGEGNGPVLKPRWLAWNVLFAAHSRLICCVCAVTGMAILAAGQR